MKKRIIISVLAVWTAIWLAACGKSVENSNEPEKEYAYLPEYVELEMSEWVSCQNIRFAGDCVYYNRVFFDVVNQTNVPVLKEYSLTERKVLRQMNLLSDTEDGFKRHITDYWVQDDGKMYTAESVYSYNSNARFTFLCAYDAEWNQEWEMDITGIMDGVKNYSQTAHIAVDRDGFI
ncbi:MAG: hypothetical protein K2O57_08695, partial [Acetatifactor sp.]|nr:hypothetical protein [Acetatifactor sp.]